MSILDLRQPFFLPIWRRVALVAVCLGWSLVEFVTGAPFWGVLFGALGIYVFWQFFLTKWTASNDETEEPDP
ncbi:DUF3329 domain-containing protein [Rhodobacteraceae bacterium R_SAG10]|jgi:hypothetical protein|nr:DUF3329 domain-containing protein [Rhodobacteraceae bacterium R_SAG10]